MIYITINSHQPQFNLAMEEYCFTRLTQYDKIFLLWRNEPSIIVGKHQNTLQEINLPFVREHGIHVVRRISGGGAVYHDLNNLNYTIISNEESKTAFDFKTFSQPVIEALHDLGVNAHFSGRNDILVENKKICGNAQAYQNGRIMHHGCLLFDTDLSMLSKALEIPTDIIESKSVKSVRSGVANIKSFLREKISVTDFSEKILEQMKQKFPEIQAYHFSEKELAEINQTAKEKFTSDEWNFGHSPQCTLTRQTRFTGGKIQVFVSIENARIENIRFFGTFFGKDSDLTVFEKSLIGTDYSPNAVREKLAKLNTVEYFAGLSKEELTQAIIA